MQLILTVEHKKVEKGKLNTPSWVDLESTFQRESSALKLYVVILTFLMWDQKTTGHRSDMNLGQLWQRKKRALYQLS